MSKYEKLDAAILDKIGDEPKKFSMIYCRDVAEECIRIAKEDKTRDADRVCDRRLQALRKSGKIRSTSTGWIRT